MTEEVRQKIAETKKRKYREDPEFRAKVVEANRRNASDPEWRRKRREAQKKLWENPVYRQYMIEAHKWQRPTKEQLVKAMEAIKRDNPMRRPEVRQKVSEAQRGEKSHCWRDGRTELGKLIRHSVHFRLWREAIFERDNYTCVLSGKRGGVLHPHHIAPLSELMDRYNIRTFDDAVNTPAIWDIHNGVTLSKEAHKEVHEAYKNGFREDYEEMLLGYF
jgi:5-methylcytosine-specific restriction endonuclease McrA